MSYKFSTLLIVDDDELICRGVLRQLRGQFEHVYFATRPDDAERILEEFEVTTLVCDYDLGEAMPTGTELLTRWRQAYPNIRRAVIYSGADLSRIRMPEAVDTAVSKGASAEHLSFALGTVAAPALSCAG